MSKMNFCTIMTIIWLALGFIGYYNGDKTKYATDLIIANIWVAAANINNKKWD